MRRQFDVNGPVMRVMVENEVGRLMYGGGVYMWDKGLSRLKAERDILRRASRLKESSRESWQILEDRAAEKDRLLKKTARQRKRDRFATFAEKLAERPTGELLKIMSNIRGGASARCTLAVSDRPPMISRHMWTISVSFCCK